MEKSDIKILIVDDEIANLTLLERITKDIGYQTKTVENGADGYKIAIVWEPDLILLNVYLPDSNGINILKQLRSQNSLSNTSIVLMSEDTSEDTILSALQHNATGFIYKPIKVTELTLKIKTWIDLNVSRKELQQIYGKLSREQEIFTQYFSDDVVSYLINKDTRSNLKGANVRVTILFFDIRNFTGISENLEPEKDADQLNYLFTEIMDLILAHSGSLKKLIGNAILATFGCPISTPEDAHNAVKCALSIIEAIKNFSKVRSSYIGNELKIGIGIATGEVFAGNLGSQRRMEYTVIGEVVNEAEDLQRFTKKVKADIVIDKNTQEKVKDEFHLKRLGKKNKEGNIEKMNVFLVRKKY